MVDSSGTHSFVKYDIVVKTGCTTVAAPVLSVTLADENTVVSDSLACLDLTVVVGASTEYSMLGYLAVYCRNSHLMRYLAWTGCESTIHVLTRLTHHCVLMILVLLVVCMHVCRMLRVWMVVSLSLAAWYLRQFTPNWFQLKAGLQL